MPTLLDGVFGPLAGQLLRDLGLGLAATYKIPRAGAVFDPETRQPTGAADESYSVYASPPGPLTVQQGTLPASAEGAETQAIITTPALPATRRIESGHLLVYPSGATYRVVGHEPLVSGSLVAAVILYLAGTSGAPT